MKKRNPNRPVILALADAAAIHRWLEFVIDDRRFFNPIQAIEAKQAAVSAKLRLGEKLVAIFEQHSVAAPVGE